MMYYMAGRRSIENPLQNPDYCLYATKTFLPLLMQLEAELQGVLKDDDIEYVHRSRVATRRIRAAFPLFAECLPAERQRTWGKQIRRLTRSLGEARDLDVQVEFVRTFLAERNPEKPSGVPLFSPVEPTTVSPIQSNTAIELRQKKPENLSPSVRSRTDLWIERLRAFVGRDGKSLSKRSPEDPYGHSLNTISYHPADSAVPGLECLLLRLIQRRRVMQPEVASVASDFSTNGIIREIATYLHDLKVRAMLEGSGVHTLDTYEHAFMQIMARISDLFWFESYLSDSTRTDQHHAMRIAAKRVRYTLEAYAGLFEDHLKAEIRVIKRLQELLGDIHDCDVWIGYLPRFLEEEQERAVAYFGNHGFFELVRPGIDVLTTDRRINRATLFQELATYWDHLKEKGFWEDLSGKLSLPLQASFTGIVSTESSGPLIVALISDVHANLPALEAVLADAESRGASVVMNAGDLTGYGPFPDEVISLVRSRHIMSVIGNYDLSVLSKKWKKGKPGSREKQIAKRWAYHNISRENLDWLISLPRELRITVRGIPLLVTHGSPDSITEYLDNETPETRFRAIAANTSARLIITGHSHRASAREVDGVWFVNTGSVGRSEDGDPRACYALLTLDPFSLIHIRVSYDIERTVAEIRHRHLPDAFARIVREGRSLEVVRESDEQP